MRHNLHYAWHKINIISHSLVWLSRSTHLEKIEKACARYCDLQELELYASLKREENGAQKSNI